MTSDCSTAYNPVAMRRWLDRFLTEEFVCDVAKRTQKDPAWCRWLLATFTNEALVFMPTVFENLKPGTRVLEVGSGLGFMTLWLHLNGVHIHGLDPTSGPFDPFMEMSRAIAEHAGTDRPPVLTLGAQELDPAEHGEFDLIFSFNVLEHVSDIEAVFAAMARVLTPGGVMIHCCPNYSVPYEPHLGIPLVPFRPQLTERLLTGPVRRSQAIWDSLNFVNVSDIRRLSRRHGLKLTFDSTLMHERVQRLWSDEQFSNRHFSSPAARNVLSFARRIGFVRLLRYLPPGLSTPMLFKAEKLRNAV